MSKQESEIIILPEPRLDNTRSLADALKARRTIREISDERLSLQILSNLLWSAFGE